MNKEFVSYQTALDMKSIGFDEPCLKMAMSDIDIINTERTDAGDYPKNSHLFSCWVTIPTYSAAFRWMREKHNLSGWISHSGWYHIISKSIEINEKILSEKYKEAESACLYKLIEICKNK